MSNNEENLIEKLSQHAMDCMRSKRFSELTFELTFLLIQSFDPINNKVNYVQESKINLHSSYRCV